MKIVHLINKWSFIVTTLLYCTIYFGLIAQILLGLIQIILAILLLYTWKSLNPITRKNLISYMIIIVVYGLLALTDIVVTPYGILYFTLVPMTIAGYFLFITSIANKSFSIQNQTVV